LEKLGEVRLTAITWILDSGNNRSLESNPSPQHYGSPDPQANYRFNRSPQVTIKGKKEGLEDKTKRHVPGPGAHELHNLIGRDAPKFVMGGKHSKSINCLPSAEVPGPGSYESRNNTLQAAPKYSIYGRTKMGTSLAVRQNGTHEKISLGFDDEVPGPG
jgi:hypothetical protein